MQYDIQFIPYEPGLVAMVEKYAADMAHLADRAYTAENDKAARAVWEAAKRLEGSPAHWGGVVPGVSLDCAGSVMATLVTAGLFKLPPGVLAGIAGRGGRIRDMEDDSMTLNVRLAAQMLYFVLSYSAPEVMCIPVKNPSAVYPGDIFSPPYISVVNGRQLPPHLAVFITGKHILTTDVQTKEVKLVDFTEVHVPFAETSFTDQGQFPLVWRCISREHHDRLAAVREQEILAYINILTRK